MTSGSALPGDLQRTAERGEDARVAGYLEPVRRAAVPQHQVQLGRGASDFTVGPAGAPRDAWCVLATCDQPIRPARGAVIGVDRKAAAKARPVPAFDAPGEE